MCSLRGVWIIVADGEPVYSRRFHTVERRAQNLPEYKPIPADPVLSQLFIKQVSTLTQDQRAMNIINIDGIEDVVYLNTSMSVYLVAIPLQSGYVRTGGGSASLFDKPYITGALSLLHDLIAFIEPFAPKFEPNKLQELNSYMTVMMPFGTPIETNMRTVKTIVKQPQLLADQFTEQTRTRPAWRSVTQRGKQEIYFHIQEFISAVQYDNPALADVSQLTGGIICQAELDGTPELSVTLDKRANQVIVSHSLDQICHTLAPHHSVTNTDYTSSYKLSCTPPSMSFELCKYYVRSLEKLPLRGFYQMKEAEDGEVQILVQLKLNEEVNNEFEYCEMEIPFPNKGKITTIDSTPTAGTVTVHPERKNSLLWNIGTKFTHRNLEVALPASVYFEPGDGTVRDPFLAQNNNSYVALNFKILNWTASGVNIERKNISIFPKPSNKLYIIDRSVTSEDYKIWNSLGQALHCLPSLEHSDEPT